MKHLLTATLLLFGLTANATSLHPDTFKRTSTLTQWNLSENIPLERNVTGAHVHVDTLNKTVKLIVEDGFLCTFNTYCPAVMPREHVVELPITSISHGFCGGELIYAERDMTPVDGLKETIVIYDESTYFCHDVFLLRPTSVTYETYNPWTNETLTSEFEGSALKH